MALRLRGEPERGNVGVLQGGPDAVDNLQLLCGSCNSIKGDRDMPYLIKRLAEIEAERQARLDF